MIINTIDYNGSGNLNDHFKSHISTAYFRTKNSPATGRALFIRTVVKPKMFACGSHTAQKLWADIKSTPGPAGRPEGLSNEGHNNRRHYHSDRWVSGKQS